MAADPRLANIPALRTLAEEEARVRQDALADAWPSIDPCPPPTWASMSSAEREYLIAVELSLLSDLTRWQSRRAMERLVAEAVGLDVAGGVVFTRQARAGRKKGDWLMLDWNGDEVVVLRDTTVTDPAEALALVALHVLGSPDAHR